MSSPQNVELEAAKFLHKLIQDSKDEPTKLAAKLYVICQHMKSSGKEHSMPYQVISRAMDTVINQHGLDIESLKASRLPMTAGTQVGESSSAQFPGTTQVVGVSRDSTAGLAENEMAKDGHASSRPPAGPSNTGHGIYHGSGSHRSERPLDHESPSSLDSRSTNSQSQERHDSVKWGPQTKNKDGTKTSAKRKRGVSPTTESNAENPMQLDNRSTFAARKGKLMKAESPGMFSAKGGAGSVLGGMSIAPGSYPGTEPGFSSPMQFNGSSYDTHGPIAKMQKERSMETFSTVSSSGKGPADTEHWKHGFMRSSVMSSSERAVEGQPFSANSTKEEPKFFSSEEVPDHDGGISNSSANTNMGGGSNNIIDINMSRGGAGRDPGKIPIAQTPAYSAMPFKEQHLKQLRAQCLVFLAFRNGLMPKKLHLEIALGKFPKEGVTSEVMLPFSRQNSSMETERVHPGSSSTSGVMETESFPKEAEDQPSAPSVFEEERKHFLAMRNSKGEMKNREISDAHPFLGNVTPPDLSNPSGLTASHLGHDGHLQVGRANQAETKSEMANWTGIGSHNEASRGVSSTSAAPNDTFPERKEDISIHSQSLGDGTVHPDSNFSALPLRENWKPTSGMNNEQVKGANLLVKNVSDDDPKVSEFQTRCAAEGYKTGPVPVDETPVNGNSSTLLEKSPEQEEDEDNQLSTDSLPSPKYMTSEKWIMDHQKRKLLSDQAWALKHQKRDKRIAVCYDKLKETVSSSEDISAKTKSVIELKKLQLLKLQRRLRGGFLNDFFKPIATDMERLKAIKKHKHGRRVKQLEKFEQKMKEERQKRIRERQKEFFSEIEVHKERLEDGFKVKRERWRGLNKYVKEFHKKKERIHREKIERIQREKINLLKINDVEGYLRMVQDAKSDRVKQLLKETEKYLQKLGSKLRDAKATARLFEPDMDDNPAPAESYEITVANEDETDQAKHYLESNEKYYMMAHSIKESIAEQPALLLGGKLREYQMNGLRWLVSLYNNHLNGILADEMGLGKTVQVISLICYLMETKNDRGPFLVVVPSSVLPGWESEINFWAPSINRIVYSGPPEERRKLFKERIIHQKFNVLLTTYEYLMNKHDRPKLSKIHWHYVIIDEGHRIKNASCKLNADLKHYQSSHRLLLTGTPLQNNLDELWALLNFLLPNIFNSSDDFSQWFNKPFESNGDSLSDEALLSEEENLLIINRLHQVLRPFVLRRLKHKVENELPEKIERLVRCEASAYQKLLMKRVEENLGTMGASKARSVHNSVMELRNICNHPYISQLHAEEVDTLIPKHYLPPIVRLCGKLEMLDRLLPKLKATDHRVLFFSTMTRLLDVMEEYLHHKHYRYLRLDGHTSGGDRGALIEQFNRPNSPYFIFLLSIRAGGVGVNLQAADTVIIFDTDWNPQVDLQAQARAHRIGQKRDVLVLRLETVKTVEEQVRASAEHKLGVANQSITAGFFDNNTSAEDRREYLEALLRESKKEEAAPVLDDDALNDLLARSESEIDVFESIDKERKEEELAAWKSLVMGQETDSSEPLPPLPSRLVTEDDLTAFYEAMKVYEVPKVDVGPAMIGVKRKGQTLGSLDNQHYGRGKRAREVRSYEEQWTEEEFEKMCQADSPESPKPGEEGIGMNLPTNASGSTVSGVKIEPTAQSAPPLPSTKPPPLPSTEPPPLTSPELPPPLSSTEPPPHSSTKLPLPLPSTEPPPPPPPPTIEVTPPPPKRGRGRPKRTDRPPLSTPSAAAKLNTGLHRATVTSLSATTLPASAPVTASVKAETRAESEITSPVPATPGSHPDTANIKAECETKAHLVAAIPPASHSTIPLASTTPNYPHALLQGKGRGRKPQARTQTQTRIGAPQRRGKKQVPLLPTSVRDGSTAPVQVAPSTLPTPIGSEVNPVSSVSKEVVMASDSSSNAASKNDSQNVPSKPFGSSPTIVTFEVNPISGLQKMVELVPVRTPVPPLGLEHYKNVVPALENKESPKVVSGSGVKATPSRRGKAAQRVCNVSTVPAVQAPNIEQPSPSIPLAPMIPTSDQNIQKTAPPGFDAPRVEPSSSTTVPEVRSVELLGIHNNPPVIAPQVTIRPSQPVPARGRQRKTPAEKKPKPSTPVRRGPRRKDTAATPVTGLASAEIMNQSTITSAPIIRSITGGAMVKEQMPITSAKSTQQSAPVITHLVSSTSVMCPPETKSVGPLQENVSNEPVKGSPEKAKEESTNEAAEKSGSASKSTEICEDSGAPGQTEALSLPIAASTVLSDKGAETASTSQCATDLTSEQDQDTRNASPGANDSKEDTKVDLSGAHDSKTSAIVSESTAEIPPISAISTESGVVETTISKKDASKDENPEAPGAASEEDKTTPAENKCDGSENKTGAEPENKTTEEAEDKTIPAGSKDKTIASENTEDGESSELKSESTNETQGKAEVDPITEPVPADHDSAEPQGGT